MKKIFLLTVLGLSLTLTACSEGTTTNQGSEQVASTQSETTTENKEDTPAEDGTLGAYKIEFGACEKTKSTYEDGDLLMVTYTFTNNSEEAVSADTCTMLKAYQDGVEIDQAFDSELTGDNASKSIKPGVSLECKALFKLTSTSEVEVEATEFLGMDDSKVIKTYTIQ